MAVVNRLIILMGRKQAAEGRIITPTEVANATGLSRQAIHQWMKNDVVQFRGETVRALCKYFDCSVDDLLYIDSNPPTDQA